MLLMINMHFNYYARYCIMEEQKDQREDNGPFDSEYRRAETMGMNLVPGCGLALKLCQIGEVNLWLYHVQKQAGSWLF